MGEVKVSVIIPIYNVEKYIAECVESVQKQTLKEIEIICVNDGCSDNSMQIVKTLVSDDKRIKIINKMNGGASSARNAGLEETKGEYIYFLDSDDYIVPETLENLYSQAMESNLDCIYFDAIAFFETEEVKNENIEYESYYVRNGDYFAAYDGMELFYQMCLNNDFKPSPCLQLIKSDVLKNNNITFYNGIIHEDNLFSLQVIICSHRVMYKKKAYYMRRIHEGSIMTTKQPIKSAYGYYICITEIGNMLAKHQFSRQVIEQFLSCLQTTAINAINAMNTMDALNEKIGYYDIFEVLEGYPMQQVIGFILWVYETRKIVWTKECVIQEENERLKNSISYKLGLSVTYIPRRIYYLGEFLIRKMEGIPYIFYRMNMKISPNKVCVSVIIPVYNASKYINACMDSLLGQTLRNIEIICVNDGSTDNSLEILKEYQQRDNRIKVIDQENQGAGSARNNGMIYARGEYLLFLDADDYFSPKLCDLAYYHAKNKKAQICLFGADREDVTNGKKEHMDWVLCENEIPGKVFSAMDINEKIFQITTGCPWSKIFEHKFIKQNQLRFQNIKNTNDVLFVRTACALAERMTCVRNEPLVTYRFNDEASTQGQKNTAPLEFFKALKELKKQLIEKNIYSRFEKSFINMLLRACIFNYNTVSSEDTRNLVRKALAEEIFPYFELEKYERNYFYNQRDYEEYKEICNRH
ncbi:MAG: glycosyltransferase [Lachnospiraceae bacterium]|nr:glycosyltransferase [Lachnospiraceae bacterium]